MAPQVKGRHGEALGRQRLCQHMHRLPAGRRAMHQHHTARYIACNRVGRAIGVPRQRCAVAGSILLRGWQLAVVDVAKGVIDAGQRRNVFGAAPGDGACEACQ